MCFTRIIVFDPFIGKGTAGVAAQVQNAAAVRAKSARRARTGVGAAAGRRSDHVAKNAGLEVMKSMVDVIEVTKAPSEFCILTFHIVMLNLLELMFLYDSLLQPISLYKLPGAPSHYFFSSF